MVHLNLTVFVRVKIDMQIEKAHPMAGIRFLAAMGNMVPPTEDPMESNPRASPRLLLNQCDTTVSDGPKITPQDI